MEPKPTKPPGILDYLNVREMIHHPAHYAVVLTNLFMLVGLVFLHWSGQLIVAAYFLETIIIGLFNVFKMGMIWKYNPKPDNPSSSDFKGGLLIPFFVFHFGFFVFVQLVVFLGFSAALDPALKDFGDHIISNIPAYFTRSLGNNFWFIVGNFTMGQVVYLVTVFLYRKDYLTETLETQMTKPYPRIVVQQVTVIISGFFLIALSNSNIVAFLLIGFKTLADIVVVQKELRKGQTSNNPFNPTDIQI